MRSIFTLALLALVLPVGCAEVVPSSGPRAPTSPDSIKIWDKRPRKYEILGTVSLAVSKDTGWQDDGDATDAIQKMIGQAAALGANGLLLKLDASTYDYLLTAGFHGAFHDIPIKADPKTAVAQAIFVINQN